jgi:hypothetical protein
MRMISGTWHLHDMLPLWMALVLVRIQAFAAAAAVSFAAAAVNGHRHQILRSKLSALLSR